jgi:hypothetical protein
VTRRPVDIQRLRDVPRELLRSRDLRDRAAASDQLRWWHNRALHDAFGVASGMSVALAADAGPVLVQPGIAYDRGGRELLLSAPRSVPLPPQQQPMTLMARYPEGRGTEADLVWQPADQAGGGPCGPGDGVPLAQLTYDRKKQKHGLTAVSPRTRPLARPHIGSGSTPGDATPWQVWDYMLSDEDSTALGLQIVVDTSTAGFTEVPCYFAWLQWPRVAASRQPYLAYLALGFQYVADEAIDHFVFRVLLPLPVLARQGHPGFALHRNRDNRIAVARSLGLSLCWLGIQHDGSAADGQEL